MNKALVLFFAGHMASYCETGQRDPQTAWKLGYPFIGNVIDYDIDKERGYVRFQRLVKNYVHDDIVEELEAFMPIFITLDPSYSPFYNTVFQRLSPALNQNEAEKRSSRYKQYLKTFSAESIELDLKSAGLPVQEWLPSDFQSDKSIKSL